MADNTFRQAPDCTVADLMLLISDGARRDLAIIAPLSQNSAEWQAMTVVGVRPGRNRFVLAEFGRHGGGDPGRIDDAEAGDLYARLVAALRQRFKQVYVSASTVDFATTAERLLPSPTTREMAADAMGKAMRDHQIAGRA